MMMIKGNSKTFTLEGRCPFCGETFRLTVPTEGYVLWKYEGALIQDALPMLTANEREQLISGICPKCWDGLFGKEEKEEEDRWPANREEGYFDPYLGEFTWDC